MSHRKTFLGTRKRVRIIHGKRAIIVRVIEVLLYMYIVLILGTLEERGMHHWQAELGVSAEVEESGNLTMTAKEKLRQQKLLRTIYTAPFSQKLSIKLPFLKYLPFYPR